MPKSFDPAKDIPNQSGKVILVTGGNAGIGAPTVKALAAHDPARIYLCARTKSTAESVVSSIHEEHPKANVEILELDLNSFDSVKQCAAQVTQRSDRLDTLILNAGVASTAFGLTKEGYEKQFGINHMGHALLTQLLMPKLLATARGGAAAAADVRVVSVSSQAAHLFSPKTGLVLDQMKTTGESVGGVTLYGHSKLANLLFAKKLAQLYPQITSVSLHPGEVRTEIFGKMESSKWFYYLSKPWLALTGISAEDGAKTQLWCATADGVESGKYYLPYGQESEGSKNANDERLRDELWTWTADELAKNGGSGWPEA